MSEYHMQPANNTTKTAAAASVPSERLTNPAAITAISADPNQSPNVTAPFYLFGVGGVN